jgi:hypothetical protein
MSITSETTTRIGELERCFKQYPDVPEEVIVKEDALRWGISWTDAALKASEGYQLKTYYLFQNDRSSLESFSQGEPFRAPEEIKLYGGQYGLLDAVLTNRLSTESPYIVDVIDGAMQLCDRSEGFLRPICGVKLRRPPRYYGLKLEDGRPYWEIGSATMWGFNGFFTVLRNCQYWGDKEECKYCDINAHVRDQLKMRDSYTVHKKVEDIKQVVAAMFADYNERTPPTTADEFESVWERGPHLVTITGGTVTKKVQGKSDIEFYLDYIEPLKELMGHGRFPLQLQTAAKTKADCKRLKDAGVDAHTANIEVWNKRLFEIICPGKNSFVGRDEWVRRLVESVEVWGEGGVWSGFVSGVEMAQPWGFKTVEEAVASTSEGLDYLMAHGVIPRPISWSVEPLSALRDQQIVPLDYFIQLDRNWWQIWRKYQLPNPNTHEPIETGRGRYPNSAYCDMGPHNG